MTSNLAECPIVALRLGQWHRTYPADSGKHGAIQYQMPVVAITRQGSEYQPACDVQPNELYYQQVGASHRSQMCWRYLVISAKQLKLSPPPK
eukprot:6462726-Amphidinium_carterae.1